MKILLFDDDKSSIDMLLTTIDWKSLGFDDVVVSYTVKQAKSLLIQNGAADIMILDIDAPGETGIDLLRWVREQGYVSENIFLTNYDSFAFASEAMKLDCVEYILKMAPVSEVVEAVKRSLKRLEDKKRLQNLPETDSRQGAMGSQNGQASLNTSDPAAPGQTRHEKTVQTGQAETDQNGQALSSRADPNKMIERPTFPAEKWAEMLASGAKGDLFSEIQTYLARATRQAENERLELLSFSHDYLRLITDFLEENGFPVNRILSSETGIMMFQSALESTFNMLQWVDYSLGIVMRTVQDAEESSSTIEQVKQYLDQNYTKKITRQDLSSLFFISPDHLSHSFSAHYGTTIPEYINQKRIQLAKEELEMGRTVTEASELAGFETLSYFSTVFKRLTGESPTDYVKNRRKVKNSNK